MISQCALALCLLFLINRFKCQASITMAAWVFKLSWTNKILRLRNVMGRESCRPLSEGRGVGDS